MKKKDDDKKEKKGFRFFTDDVIPMSQYTEGNFFFYEDWTIMDIMEIQSKDLENMSDVELQFDYLKHLKFHRTNEMDYKLICLNYPCDLSEQIRFFKRRIESTKNQYQKKWLQKALDELLWLQENKTKREYYRMFFPESQGEHDEFVLRNLREMKTGKDKLMSEMDYQKKCQILFKMSNQNMLIR